MLLVVTAELSGAEPKQLSEDDIQSLIADLGNPSFETREQAEATLLESAPWVREALEKASRGTNLEVRTRAARLLARVRQLEYQQQVELFLSGKPLPEPLPGWASFKRVVGDDVKQKQFFVKMMKGESRLLRSLDAGSDVSAELANRIQLMTRSGANMKEAVGLALLVASRLDATQYSRMSSTLYSAFRNSNTRKVIEGDPTLKKLLEGWVQSVVEAEKTDKSLIMYVVLDYGLKDLGLGVSRKLLNAPTQSQSTLDRAATCIARFGSVDDLPLLFKFMDDKRVTNTWSRGAGKKVVQTQLRDRMLAMSIHIVGKKPADFGFPYVSSNTIYIYQTYSCGFEDDEQRDKAHENWAKWWEKNKESVEKKAENTTDAK